MLIRILILSLTLLTTACLQTENSSAQDHRTVEGSSLFLSAQQVIFENCRGCHLFHTMTEDQLIATNEVVPGNAEDSVLYFSIIGSLGPRGPKDMPQNASISVLDVAKIAEWINAIP